MNNFTYHIPTEIHFGAGQLCQLSQLAESGSHVLLVYGGGSIRRSGLYDQALSHLTAAGLRVTELGGVEPNPRIATVRRGIALCREGGIDMVLAIGGGSAIDCAKLVAAGTLHDGDPWDLILDSGKIQGALPIYCVPTLASTGSEMDAYAVISNPETREKLDICSPFLKPRMSILDPEITFTAPPAQTAAGAADIFSHVLENYFTQVRGAFIQARLCEGMLQTILHYAPIALREPDNYEARANLLWTASLAINDLVSCGAEVEWCVHPIEHELSAFYDITHGVGLAILTPAWMDFVLEPDTAWKFAQYGRSVFGLTGQDDLAVGREAIAATRDFFRRLGLPATLREVGIDETHLDEMSRKAAENCGGCFVPLTAQEIRAIYDAAL